MPEETVPTTDTTQEPLALDGEPVAEETGNDTSDESAEETTEVTESDENRKRYFEAVGRRKRSVARVRLMTRKSGDETREDAALMTVNGKDYLEYFTDKDLVGIVESPLRKLKSLHRFKITVKVVGGGIAGQADAIRHGISRTLEQFDENFRKKLKKAGFLTRDPRKKERKKYGLKKARKAPRWSKR
jgi:small subunit ribosomal protein S9